MKAVVLVGERGTHATAHRDRAEALAALMDRRSLDHVLDHVARHGVHEVVLSSPYLEEVFHPFIEARHGDPSIMWITETHARHGRCDRERARGPGREPFFALNGDILTDLDLTAMRAFHDSNDAAVTIALHHVDDARAFGLVATDAREGAGVPREARGSDPRRRERRTYLSTLPCCALDLGETVSIERTSSLR